MDIEINKPKETRNTKAFHRIMKPEFSISFDKVCEGLICDMYSLSVKLIYVSTISH